MEEVSAGRWRNGAASSDITTSVSGVPMIRRGCEASVWAPASSDDHTLTEETFAGKSSCPGTCFIFHDFPSETVLCGERDGCGTPMLNYERLVSDSGWLVNEENSASSVVTAPMRPSSVGDVGESGGGNGTPMLDNACLVSECGWIEDKTDHCNLTVVATGALARYLKIVLTTYGHVEADKVQTILPCCNDFEEWLKENQAEQQHLTSSDGWILSRAEVERKSTEFTSLKKLLMALEGHRGQSLQWKRLRRTPAWLMWVKTEKAIPDSARKRNVNAKETRTKRANETRTVLDRRMGSRAQLPSGSEAVVNDNKEGRALSHSAFNRARFLAASQMFHVYVSSGMTADCRQSQRETE